MNRRKKRRNWPLITISYALIASCFAYVAVLPVLQYWPSAQDAASLGASQARWMMADAMRTRLFETMIYAWVFMFGACIGSFLNVVIYRVPRRMSLLGVSKCPFCRVAIHGYDNIPVFAWIALRGRCRSCRLPISVRYPVVEFAVGAIFLALAIAEVFNAGSNLPGASGGHSTTLGWFIGRPDWGLLAIYAYHCVLLCTLFSWAWIQADGRAIPLAYALFVISAGVLVAALRPDVHPVAWYRGLPDSMTGFGWTDRLDTTFVGFVVGSTLGALLGTMGSALRSCCEQPRYRGHETALAYAIVGVFLGWQAALTVAGLAVGIVSVWLAIRAFLHRSASPVPTAVVFTATLLQVFAWQILTRWLEWPFPGTGL